MAARLRDPHSRWTRGVRSRRNRRTRTQSRPSGPFTIAGRAEAPRGAHPELVTVSEATRCGGAKHVCDLNGGTPVRRGALEAAHLELHPIRDEAINPTDKCSRHDDDDDHPPERLSARLVLGAAGHVLQPPVRGARFLSVVGRRLGVLAAVELGPTPRPDAIDLHLERETEADPDQNDDAKDGDTLDGRVNDDGPDDVGND